MRIVVYLPIGWNLKVVSLAHLTRGGAVEQWDPLSPADWNTQSLGNVMPNYAALRDSQRHFSLDSEDFETWANCFVKVWTEFFNWSVQCGWTVELHDFWGRFLNPVSSTTEHLPGHAMFSIARNNLWLNSMKICYVSQHQYLHQTALSCWQEKEVIDFEV